MVFSAAPGSQEDAAPRPLVKLRANYARSNRISRRRSDGARSRRRFAKSGCRNRRGERHCRAARRAIRRRLRRRGLFFCHANAKRRQSRCALHLHAAERARPSRNRRREAGHRAFHRIARRPKFGDSAQRGKRNFQKWGVVQRGQRVALRAIDRAFEENFRAEKRTESAGFEWKMARKCAKWRVAIGRKVIWWFVA